MTPNQDLEVLTLNADFSSILGCKPYVPPAPAGFRHWDSHRPSSGFLTSRLHLDLSIFLILLPVDTVLFLVYLDIMLELSLSASPRFRKPGRREVETLLFWMSWGLRLYAHDSSQ